MNKALLAKIGWRLLNDKTSLWARVLRSKYKVLNERDTHWLTVKRPKSSTWRSVEAGLREVVIPGLKWVIGDGNSIRFWADRWLHNTPLMELVRTALLQNYGELRARDLWDDNTGWQINQIEPHVSEEIMLQLRSVVIDTVTGAEDRLAWGGSTDGKFTVKTAYSMLIKDVTPRPALDQLYRRVWHVVAPERIRVFIWLGVNQVLMTNQERLRRHLSATSLCQVCKSGEETILHILRDCPAMAGIWTRLVPGRKRQTFFIMTLLEWLYENLGDTSIVGDSTWATVFAVSVWWGWKWRCGNVFGTNGKCRDRVKFLRDLATEVSKANHKINNSGSSNGGRTDCLIMWKRPNAEWMKVNTDGASKGNPGLAAAGGVLRNAEGNWCAGFAVNIGICSAPLAELWGVYYGLYIAWERRVTKLELEVDSATVVDFLKTGICDSHPLSFLVRLCHGFLLKDWSVRITHVYREANRLADGLANHAFSLSLGFHLFVSMPDCVSSLALDDLNGTAFPRSIRL